MLETIKGECMLRYAESGRCPSAVYVTAEGYRQLMKEIEREYGKIVHYSETQPGINHVIKLYSMEVRILADDEAVAV